MKAILAAVALSFGLAMPAFSAVLDCGFPEDRVSNVKSDTRYTLDFNEDGVAYLVVFRSKEAPLTRKMSQYETKSGVEMYYVSASDESKLREVTVILNTSGVHLNESNGTLMHKVSMADCN